MGCELEWLQKRFKGKGMGHGEGWAENNNKITKMDRRNRSRFKDFQTKFELGQTRINLNKLFKDISNLELFKISLNIQIQTKA
jgi:hypothetical protein